VSLYEGAAPSVSSDYYARGSTRMVLRADAVGGGRRGVSLSPRP